MVGGIKVTIKEFSLATPVVLTSDLSPTGLVVRWQDLQRKMAKLSAQWAHDLAEEEFTKVLTVQTKLETSGKHLADSQMLLKKSRDFINESLNHRRNGEYSEAYATAQRALRPLRILMRTAWEQALRDLDSRLLLPIQSAFSPSLTITSFGKKSKLQSFQTMFCPMGTLNFPLIKSHKVG